MHDGQPIDARTHLFAMSLSYELVAIVEPCLRPEELHELATEYYRVIVRRVKEQEEKRRQATA